MSLPLAQISDLFIIGGGINGCGIARDASGRGLSVVLAEQGDLAQGTSSHSTKLFHGGLRYLEFFEFNLVRKALAERETLLIAMPHISRPMRFVLPLSPEMRFESDTPASRLLARVMPWLKGRRPDWMIRLGLFLYDYMGGRKILPGTRTLDLTQDAAGKPLQRRFRKAFEYSDCVVEDSRLVVLNARDAAARGATILTRTKVIMARRLGDLWRITLQTPEGIEEHLSRALVNAGGPWAMEVIEEVAQLETQKTIRLVRGSHIVVPSLFDHGRSYFLQGEDGRIIFAIPYEGEFTLIGTTDEDHFGNPQSARCTPQERDYLISFANRYFRQTLTEEDVVWSFSGVRPLYDDGASSATAATRDYVLKIEAESGAPLLNVFGGKITTYRKLSEQAMEALSPFFPGLSPAWTAGIALPGGSFPHDGVEKLTRKFRNRAPWLFPAEADRMIRTYGTEAFALISEAQALTDLGEHFGAGLTEAEVRWQMAQEWAQTAEDVVWRRTRLGLKMTDWEIEALDQWMKTGGDPEAATKGEAAEESAVEGAVSEPPAAHEAKPAEGSDGLPSRH